MVVKAFSYEYFNESLKFRRKNITLFNGAFDLLHPGHLKLINNVKNSARLKNGISICCLNSNKSVNIQKKSHPLINDEITRAKMIEALNIDYVIIFDELTPLKLIQNIMPNTIIKGSDYKNKDYLEKEFISNSNINLLYVDLEEDYSTSNIYNIISNQVKNEIRESI